MIPYDWSRIRSEWGWIRNGLLDVISRTGERWVPEDVWSALRANNAFLYGFDDGFVVVRKELDPDGPCLFVWVMWAEPGYAIKHRHELHKDLTELAWSIGAKRMRFESPRDGWSWWEAWNPVRTVYECEV